MATSLWGSRDGVLNQIRGVGAKTTESLLKNNVVSFADVSTKSSYDIEQLTNRKQPFGQELRASAAKILRNSLTMRAHIEKDEENNSSQKFVKCKIERSYPDHNSKYEQNICWYTLAVYSDQPKESILMFRENLSKEGEHRIACPNIFSKINVHLISNLIGLDVSTTLDNKDTAVKVPTESPARTYFNADEPNKHVISFSKRGKKTENKEIRRNANSGKRAELTEHSSLVQSVKDFRVRSKSDFFKEVKSDKRSLTPTNQDTTFAAQKFVTPSPSLPLHAQSKDITEKTSKNISLFSQKKYDTSKSKKLNMGFNEKRVEDEKFSNNTFTPNNTQKYTKSTGRMSLKNTWQNQKYKQQVRE